MGRLYALNDTANVAATTTEFTGRIKEYFDSFVPPMAPTLRVGIEGGRFNLQVVLDRASAGRPPHDFVDLH